MAGDELIASLPRYGPQATSYQELLDQGFFDSLGLTPADRAAGVPHSQHLFHLDGT